MTLRRRLLAGLVMLATTVIAACAADKTSVGPGSRESSSGSSGKGASGPDAPDGTSPDTKDSGGPADPGPQTNGFPPKWIDGTACGTDPDIQTWEYAAGTFILRQSLCTNFEGPFLYLLIGTQKALLVDTGTGNVALRAKVLELLGGKAVELVVAHSHAHGDHVGGDNAFKNQPSMTVVGTSATAVKQMFAIQGEAPGSIDLGGRVVDVLHIPGHQAAHVAFYDHATKLLLTGDTLYPGRLYIDDWASYRTSIPRLLAFVDGGRPVSFVLGAHIELPKTGADYAGGVQQHPNEHVLQLTDAELRKLDTVVKAQGDQPSRTVRPHFILSP